MANVVLVKGNVKPFLRGDGLARVRFLGELGLELHFLITLIPSGREKPDKLLLSEIMFMSESLGAIRRYPLVGLDD